MWSPQTKSNGGTNPFYEFMRIVAPGDIIFSFQGTYIRAIGTARSSCYPSPKPAEFKGTGPNWNQVGWRVDVQYRLLRNQIRPAAHLDFLEILLPKKYSPLQTKTGRGNQGVYLTNVSPMLAEGLVSLIGEEADLVRQDSVEDQKNNPDQDVAVGLVEWEEHLLRKIDNDTSLDATEKLSLVLARRGQGIFKQNVMHIEKQCRLSGVNRVEHLRASHIKPWRNCESVDERLSGANGLLLTPTFDHLFDRGFISFEDQGNLIISEVAHAESIRRMGLEPDRLVNVGLFNQDQKSFLDYHRNKVLLRARL